MKVSWKGGAPPAGRTARQDAADRTCGAEHPATVYAECGVLGIILQSYI